MSVHQPRIVVVGDVLTDVLALLAAPLSAGSDTSAEIRLTGGGQAANTSAWLAWRGYPVTLVAAVGEDEPGRARIAELTGAGVHCAIRRYPDTPTGTVIALSEGGERSMITQRGANLRLRAEDVAAALVDAPDTRHLHLSAYPLLDTASRPAGLRALAAAREAGLTTSVDAASAAPLRRVGVSAFRDWVRDVDLLLANHDEAVVLAGDRDPGRAARELTGVARRVVVKLGGQGAVWADREGQMVRAEAKPISVIDATGAGDAFAAGLIGAWVTGAGPVDALRTGARLGAIAVATVGARPAGTCRCDRAGSACGPTG